MLIWRGYGILVAVFAFIGYAASAYSAEALWGSPLSPMHRSIMELAGMLLAAGLVYALHFSISRTEKPKVMIEKDTGKEVILLARHDFFFVPVKYWPYVLAGLGVLFFFQS